MGDRTSVRLARELKAFKKGDKDDHIDVDLYDPQIHGGNYGKGGDLLLWHATLDGPKGTPFEGGKYRLLLRVPKEYPMVPPHAHFITKVFHPNVQFENGDVCLNILKSEWTPAWGLRTVCLAVLILLGDPEPSSPFNCDAGNLLREGDLLGYSSLVRYYAGRFAGAPRLSWDEDNEE